MQQRFQPSRWVVLLAILVLPTLGAVGVVLARYAALGTRLRSLLEPLYAGDSPAMGFVLLGVLILAAGVAIIIAVDLFRKRDVQALPQEVSDLAEKNRELARAVADLVQRVDTLLARMEGKDGG